MWLATLADLFVNLSAGWFGIVFVVPISTKESKPGSFWVLIANLLFAIVSLMIAVKFNRLAGL